MSPTALPTYSRKSHATLGLTRTEATECFEAHLTADSQDVEVHDSFAERKWFAAVLHDESIRGRMACEVVDDVADLAWEVQEGRGRAGVSGFCVTFIFTHFFALEELLQGLRASACGFGCGVSVLLTVSLEERHDRRVRR
jgi:hypothetical protein